MKIKRPNNYMTFSQESDFILEIKNLSESELYKKYNGCVAAQEDLKSYDALSKFAEGVLYECSIKIYLFEQEINRRHSKGQRP